jgi:cytochrome b561
MSVQTPPARYSRAAIILHWLLAALLIFQVSLGWRLEELAGLPQFAAYQLHKTIGIVILLLSIARLGIRIFVPRPRPVNTSMLLAALAGGVHALFYVVLIVGPITGWIIVSTSSIRVPTLLFGAIPWPHLPLSSGWHDPAEAIHELLGWLTAGLVFLHVAGALRHHMQRKDLIGRMVPASLGTRSALNGVAAVAVGGAAMAFVLAWLLPFGGSGSSTLPMKHSTRRQSPPSPMKRRWPRRKSLRSRLKRRGLGRSSPAGLSVSVPLTRDRKSKAAFRAGMRTSPSVRKIWQVRGLS